MARPVRCLVLVAGILLAACSSPNAQTPPTQPTKAPAVKPSDAATSGPGPAGSVAPSAGASGTPRPGPTSFTTNRPSVTVSAGATVAPEPTPTPAATFGPVALGLTGDGDGRDPRNVLFWGLGDLEVQADGTVWIAAASKLWKLKPGGKLELVGGAHLTPDLELDGKPVSAAGFAGDTPLTLHPDGDGPPLLAFGHVLARLGADGKLAVLWRGDADDRVEGILPLGDGKLQLLIRSGGADRNAGRYAWWSARPGAASIRLRAATEDEADAMRQGEAEAYHDLPQQTPLGVPSNGKLVVRSGGGGVLEIDPAGGATRLLGGSGYRPDLLDSRGKAYVYDGGTGKLATVSAGKAGETLAGSLPAGFVISALASAPDGAIWVAGSPPAGGFSDQRIYKLQGGGTELVGGLAGAPLGAPLDTAIRGEGMVALSPSEILVSDGLRGRILRLKAGGKVEAAYGEPGGVAPADGGDAAVADLAPGALARDGKGNLYFIQASKEVWRIDADGELARLYVLPTSGDSGLFSALRWLAATPDGDLLVGGSEGVKAGTPTGFLVHVGAKGAVDVPLKPGTELIEGMATAPDGAIVFGLAPFEPAGGALTLRLMRWTPADAPKEVASGSWRASSFAFGVLGTDAKGRWYIASGAGLPGTGVARAATITRFEPADGTRTLVTGPGSGQLAGDTQDDGLMAPLGLQLLPGGEALVLDTYQVKRLTVAP